MVGLRDPQILATFSHGIVLLVQVMLDRRVAARLRVDFEHLDLSLLGLRRLVLLLDGRWRLRASVLFGWERAFLARQRLVGVVVGEIGRLNPVLGAHKQVQLIIFRRG